MEQQDFGAHLRDERERRGISLEAIAQHTKIGAAVLKALERGDLSRWPPGLYRRAYLRSYAGVVGLDADDLIREIQRLFPEDEEGAGGRPPQRRMPRRPRRAPGAGPRPSTPRPPREPLRLTFDRSSAAFRWPDARRVTLAVCELALFLGAGALGWRASGSPGFWVALGLVACVYHLAGTLLWGSPLLAGRRVPHGLRQSRRVVYLGIDRMKVHGAATLARSYEQHRRPV